MARSRAACARIHQPATTGLLTYADLGATVHVAAAPATIMAELPELYSSCFSVVEFFQIYDRLAIADMRACELEHPRHAVIFTVCRSTAKILNRVADFEPEALDRIAAALFRAFPHVKRIQAETKFAPCLLQTPYRELGTSCDFVITLATTEAAYRSSIGPNTRRKIPQYINRLRREHPDFELRTLKREEITLDLVRQTVEWNSARLKAKGVVSIYKRDPGGVDRLWRILQAYGVAVCGCMGDTIAAVTLVLKVGQDAWGYASGFDRAYEDLHLGFLMSYFTAVECIDRGCRRLHMLWGTPEYKRRLGAMPMTAHHLSLFPSSLCRFAYAGEAVPRDWAADQYYRSRRQARKALEAIGLLAPRPPHAQA